MTALAAHNRSPYPLLLRPLLFPKVWGGSRLAQLGKPVTPADRIGESWEVADLDATSASGAGGGAAHSTILNGPLAGRSLRDAVHSFGDSPMFGASAHAHAGAPFPLLVKFLDARENLSVQVHPSIAYAKAHPGTHIKTECWYILHAEPASVIYKGVKPGITRESFERHLRAGDGSAVVDDLLAVPAVPGDMHNLPSGTVHALGAGVLVAEVQTPSDTTFRVFDWGRAGRELHIDAAMQCITFDPTRDATRRLLALRPDAPPTVSRLVATGFYVVDEICSAAAAALPLNSELNPASPRCLVLTCVAGSARIVTTNLVTPLALGQTAVVPASLTSAGTLHFDAPATLLRTVVM